MKQNYMSAKSIFDNKKMFKIFLKTEKILKTRHFPAMSNFANEEIRFFIKTARKYIKRDEKIIEMGCGSGRVIKKLNEAGFSADGFDNNILFIKYCRKHNLNAFYLDATKTIPKKYKTKYKIVGITLNTLFNFPKKIRRKWILSAHDLLKEKGVLIMSIYSDNKFSRRTIKERLKFYENVLTPPKGFRVKFFDKNKRKGIHLCDNHQKEIWFSECLSMNEVIKEVNSWKNFKIISIKPMKCGIAWEIILIKK